MSNFVEMGYDRMNRTDYTAADVAKFRQQVVDFVVPLSVKLRERQAKRLGVDKLAYYDFGSKLSYQEILLQRVIQIGF
jgi:oligoendopeptidase F